MTDSDDLPGLSARQAQVFTFISRHISRAGYPPTIREIGEALGIRSTNGVADHLKALKRKGYLRQQDNKSRTWQIRAPGSSGFGGSPPPQGEPANLVAVPRLGRVAAGEPILAEEQAEGTVLVDSAWLGAERPVFALQVVGHSMIDAGILHGDTVLVHKRSEALAGQIVVVIIDNEATVKRFYREGDRIRLQPANQTMAPIYLSADEAQRVEIMGVVVGVYRRL